MKRKDWLMSGHDQRFAKGEFIFREGTQGDRGYEIVSGEVLVYREGPDGMIPLARLGSGDMFGEMFVLTPDGKRNASAVAITEVVVSVYFEETLRKDLEDMNPRQRKFVEGLVSKLNNTTGDLTQHKAPLGLSEKELVRKNEQVEDDRITLH